MRRARQAGLRAAAGLTLALLAGCTALKLTYNNLDWLAQWQVGRFVDLEPPQKQLFDRRFREFWGWHRSTQLTLYAQDIRELAGKVDRPLSSAEVEQYFERSQAHMARTLQNAVPDTALVLKALDDEQVRELLDSLAEHREKSRKESGKLTRARLIERSEETMLKNLRRWIGSPTRDQKQRVAQWSRERQYAGTMWHQYQEAWAGAFTEVLAHRREPDFARRLSVLFDGGRVPYGEEMERVRQHNRRLLVGVLADLSGMLTPGQRSHLRERLQELADDLETLARESRDPARRETMG